MHNPRIAFFGSAPLGVASLNALAAAQLFPQLIVTQPDRPAGRGNTLTSPPEKIWALEHGIAVLQPEKLDAETIATLARETWDVFVVTAYGKMLPQALIDIPRLGVVNLHPSLLPRLRGPSPIRSAILGDEKKTGVSIMLIDDKMDHGPLLAQKEVTLPEWPPHGLALDTLLAQEGSELLASSLSHYLAGTIVPVPQDHTRATVCGFISKEDGRLDLSADAYDNLLKIRGLEGWPGTYAFFVRNGEQIRVKILDAHIEHSKLIIDTVKPEGKGEMPYADFVRSGAIPDLTS